MCRPGRRSELALSVDTLHPLIQWLRGQAHRGGPNVQTLPKPAYLELPAAVVQIWNGEQGVGW